MKLKRIVSIISACTMLSSAPTFAQPDLTYISDGLEVSVPYAGQLVSSVDCESGVLVTAVYDSTTGGLEMVDISDSMETDINVDTLNGKMVKNFVLDSMGSLRPLGALSEKSLVVRAEAEPSFCRTVITWSRMRDFDCEYYSVEKNGEAVARVEGGIYSYVDNIPPAGEDVYTVKAYNSKNELVALGNDAYAGDGKNVFDASAGLVEVVNPYSLTKVTYSGADRQIALWGTSASLDADTNVGINADYGWTTSEIGGRSCVYTNYYYNNTSDSAIVKRGNIYVELGSDYDYDKGNRMTKIVFDYYDTGSGGINIRYVNGVDETGVSTHKIIKVPFSSEGWKTATVDVSDGYFNKAADSRLQRFADLRFEPAGTSGIGNSPLYIGRIEFDTDFDGYGEYIVASDNNKTSVSTAGTERDSGSYVSLMGDETISAVTSDDGSVSYVSTTVTDTAYMFVEDIDGKSAVMSTVFTNKNNANKTGTLSFALDEGAFVPEDNIYIIKIEYNSNYAAPRLNYVSGVTEAVADDGTVSYTYSYTTKSPVETQGEGVWKTAVFKLENAVFNYKAGEKHSGFYNGLPVFRVVCSSTTYISSVSVVLPWSIALGSDYTEASVTFDSNGQTANGVRVYDALCGSDATSDNVMVYTQAGSDNSWAVSSNSYRDGNSNRRTYIYFTIDDDRVYAGRDNYVEIEFTYLDASKNTMTLQYNSENGLRSVSRAQMGSGEWKTEKIVLRDAYLGNFLNNSTDFRMYLNTSTEDNQLIIKSLKVRNIGCATEEFVAVPDIYLAGDSTCEPFYTNASGVPREGWGMELGGVFVEDVDIINKAKGGKSSRSFINDRDITSGANNPDNRWSEILLNGKAGDYLFIQFGHNDRSGEDRSTDPDSLEINDQAYRYNLKRFVVAARERGMIPVFLTSLWVRHNFNDDGTLADTTIEPYRQAMREVGEQYSVPVLDVGAVHKELVERLGVEGSKQIFCHVSEEEYPDFAFTRDDNTHINKTGAIEVCKIIANEIKRLAPQYPEIRRLSDYIDTTANLEYIG